MKTTLTQGDFDLLAFAAGVLTAAGFGGYSDSLQKLIGRQRELKDDEPDAEPPVEPMPAKLPRRFAYFNTNAREERIGELVNAGRDVRIHTAEGRRMGELPLASARRFISKGVWTYLRALPDEPTEGVRHGC